MNIVWYRNDLRISDHQPLSESLARGKTVGLYCFDPRQFRDTRYGFKKTGSLRASFLIESVQNLKDKLNGNLIVKIGHPETIIPEVVKNVGAEAVYCSVESTSEELDVERSLRKNLGNIPVHSFHTHTMYHPEDVPFDLQNIPDVFTQFRKKAEKKSRVRDPLPTPEAPPEPHSEIDYGNIPTIVDLGLDNPSVDDRSVLSFKGGETEAWKRLEHYFFESDELRNYKFTRNGLLGKNYSSKFSPWLAHGCISARSIHQKVEEYEKSVHKNVSTYWMKFELIWRDYFRFSAMKHGSSIFHLGGIQGKDLQKNQDKDLFQKWANGVTGIPFIDANMRELNNTGYMSNRGRQNVASFLAQNLNFDWRWGAAWFESKLIDYDVCSNWGNWAYNATVGYDPRNRYFNIVGQARKYDKKGEYVRHWLPELKELPSEFVHKPHKMTIDQQKLYSVELGRDYPEPIIDLDESYEEIKQRG
jgi:deoxyribodipyrimidine photo-lyase